jgi:hypothetical protein
MSFNIKTIGTDGIVGNHPMLVPLAQNLGLTEAQIDQAFIEASAL